MSVRIIIGDAFEQLALLPSESVHCVVTSPPYWGLRDYGIAGQLGMERTLGEHLSSIVEVFREVRRVLRNDGTLWLNYGDSYATSVNGRSAADTKASGKDDRTFRDKPFSTIGPIYDPAGGGKGGGARRGLSGNKGCGGDETNIPAGRVVAGGQLKPKDLCGIPWRVAFGLQEDGWWLRQDIIWSKPNPMPESVTDRCTKSHEYLFLLTKSARYYFEQEALREKAAPSSLARWGQDIDGQAGSDRVPGKTNGTMKAVGGIRRHRPNGAPTQEFVPGGNTCGVPEAGRNKRSVWTIATARYFEAHFATFPPALVEPCILAGCPKDGTVLDPFGGAGTTGLVAVRLGRNAILIEINPEYAEMARRCIEADAGMFAQVEAAE
jgi:DNA modification methylase